MEGAAGGEAPAQEAEDVSVRLYEKAKIAQARKVMLSKLLPEQCSFTPQVNARAVEGREGECHERLHLQAQALREKKLLLAEAGEAGCTFSPTITKKAQKLMEESERQRMEKGLSAGESLYAKVRGPACSKGGWGRGFCTSALARCASRSAPLPPPSSLPFIMGPRLAPHGRTAGSRSPAPSSPPP